jgi:hypothetical protein
VTTSILSWLSLTLVIEIVHAANANHAWNRLPDPVVLRNTPPCFASRLVCNRRGQPTSPTVTANLSGERGPIEKRIRPSFQERRLPCIVPSA